MAVAEQGTASNIAETLKEVMLNFETNVEVFLKLCIHQLSALFRLHSKLCTPW